MSKKERIKEIKEKYQDRLKRMGNNDLIDADLAYWLAFFVVIVIGKLKAADGRRKDYKKYERLTLENLEKAFQDVEEEARRREDEKAKTCR